MQLNVLAVCERIIIDAKGIPSLINLFQRMDVQLQEAPLPADASAPGRWAIFSMWQLLPEEVGRDFVQHTKVFRPDGTSFAELVQPFRIESDIDLFCRTYIDFPALPVGQEGRVQIITWLATEESNVHECYFYIKHVPMPTPQAAISLSVASTEAQ